MNHPIEGVTTRFAGYTSDMNPNNKPDARSANDDHPHHTSSDEADPEQGSTPAGIVGDIRELADNSGGTTDPDDVALDPDAAPQPPH